MANARCQQVMLPAESMRGGKLATDFRDALTMARDGWTAFGTPTYAPGGGAILNGSTQYYTRPLAGELNSASLTIHVEFTPTFAANDGVNHPLMDTATTGRYIITKGAGNSIEIYAGAATIIATSTFATYGAYWLQNQRNLLTLSTTSGGGATNLWLNGVLIASSSVNWTRTPTATIQIARSGAGYFAGTIHRLLIGHHTSTLAEHTAYYNRSMWNWENRCTVNLQFRTADYDFANKRTLDSSGNGNHFTLGDGSTPTTYPTQGNGRMTFDGGDYLARAAVAQPTGAFSVYFCCAPSVLGTQMYIGAHCDAALSAINWRLLKLNTNIWQFYSGGGAGANASSSSAISSNQILTLVGVADGTRTVLYVNGVAQTGAVAPLLPSSGTQPMTVGARPGPATYLTGTVYDYKYLDGVALNNVQAYDYYQKQMARIGAEV